MTTATLPDFATPLPPREGQREIQFREALPEAMSEEMRKDPRIFLMGEEVAQYNGAYKVSQGMLDEFGPKRIIDSPISENGFAGLAVGAAMYGLRPIIEFMSWSFSLVAADQILNNVAMPYMSGGRVRGNDARGAILSTHSWSVEGLLQRPGREDSSQLPRDAKGLAPRSSTTTPCSSSNPNACWATRPTSRGEYYILRRAACDARATPARRSCSAAGTARRRTARGASRWTC